MRENRTSGTVAGAPGNRSPYAGAGQKNYCGVMSQVELEESGWASITGVVNDDQLIGLAREIGTPVMLLDGSFIKRLKPRQRLHAAAGTFGSLYGTGPYPLHTDTAHWTNPSRIIVMRVTGDLRRSTTLLSFATVLAKADGAEREDIERSVWYSGVTGRRFCCSMRFKTADQVGLRYDPLCMSPANPAARRAKLFLEDCFKKNSVCEFSWTKDTALVILNWKVLHGRGIQPLHESDRVLHRIYVN
jgi:hypothetical protein